MGERGVHWLARAAIAGRRRNGTVMQTAAPIERPHDGVASDVWLETFGQAALADPRAQTACMPAISRSDDAKIPLHINILAHDHVGAAAGYAEELINLLSVDLTTQHGRGFSARNLYQMRLFYSGWEILQTPSAKFEARAKFLIVSQESATTKVQTPSGKSLILQTPSAKLRPSALSDVFPLSWSHYVRLMSVEKPHARLFYESEAIRGGWSVRQLDRQIGTQFFERTAHSRRQPAMLSRGQKALPQDALTVEEEVRNPYLLEFLNL